ARRVRRAPDPGDPVPRAAAIVRDLAHVRVRGDVMRAAPLWIGGAGLVLGACGGGGVPVERGPVVSSVPLTRTPVIEPEEPADGIEVVTGKGHVEPAAVDAGLAPHREALSSCYMQRVGKRRWLGGHLALRWDVAADGSIEHVLLTDSDLGAWPVE